MADPSATSTGAAALQVTKTTTPKSVPSNSELAFGKNMTDHMLCLEWTVSEGWVSSRITAYQNLSLDPANSALQYGLQAFEGMKAFKDKKGNARLFRPQQIFERMNKSAARMAMPALDTESVVELLKAFVSLEERFIPS